MSKEQKLADIIAAPGFCMKNTKYIKPEDLLTDEGFLAWYYHTDEIKVEEWNLWIAANFFNQCLAEEAICLLGRAGIEEAGITDDQIKEAAKYFINTIVENEKRVPAPGLMKLKICQ